MLPTFNLSELFCCVQVNQWCESGIYLLASQAVDKCQSQDGAESALTDIERFLESAEKNQLTELKNLHNQYEVVLSEDIKVWRTQTRAVCKSDDGRGVDGELCSCRPTSWRHWSAWRTSRRCLRSGTSVWRDCRPNKRGPSSPSPRGLNPLLSDPPWRIPPGPPGPSSVSRMLLLPFKLFPLMWQDGHLELVQYCMFVPLSECVRRNTKSKEIND